MRRMNISYAKSYIDKNTNATKTKWVNIGSLVVGDDGKIFGDIESIPVGVSELKFNCFDKEERQQQPQHQQNYQQPPTQYQNAQGQATDAQGNLLQPQYQRR